MGYKTLDDNKTENSVMRNRNLVGLHSLQLASDHFREIFLEYFSNLETTRYKKNPIAFVFGCTELYRIQKVRGGEKRRRADSNRRIKVLQTSPLDHLGTPP